MMSLDEASNVSDYNLHFTNVLSTDSAKQPSFVLFR